jgi:FtsP/CotA-like multicopper oxidase with cupredoxin domain
VLEAFYGLEFLLLLALAFVWGLTGMAANGLKYVAFREARVSRWRQAARIGVWAGLILILLWYGVMTAAHFTLGWYFVMDRFIVMLPLLALPALFVIKSAVPYLKKNTVLPSGSLANLVTSIHTMTAGTILVLYLVLFDIPSIPDFRESTMYLAVLAACAVLLYLYHRERVQMIRSRPQGILALAVRNTVLAFTAVVMLTVWYLWSLHNSRFPESMAMIHPETFDFGGGAEFPGAASADHGGHHSVMTAGGNVAVSVADLTGPETGEPDKRFTLVAEKKTVKLASGHTIEAWTFNGQVPGPQLVVHEGDLVEVKLVNRDIEQGVTVHWHGVDVPNAEDGAAGVTQDAVMPGQSHTYRFVVEETGSHWYHSHQVSSIQVAKGLFGAFIILPKRSEAIVRGESETGGEGANVHGKNETGGEGADVRGESETGGTADVTVFSHDWETPEGMTAVLHPTDPVQSRIIKPGTKVRLRLINSASNTKIFSLHGTPFQVSAIDGNDIHKPEAVTGKRLKIGGGGRYDVTFTMPDHPVTLALHGRDPESVIVFSKDGQGIADIQEGGAILDPLEYGAPAPAPFDDTTEYDREFLMVLDQIYFGNYNGRSNQLWAVNGEVFPHTPTFAVQAGDLVKTRIVNRTFSEHPMHLHGHHVFVLSRNGEPYKGSPLWLDTLLVEPGETYEVAFRADNPGIWMDHCHILEHAAWGMSMHLTYANVTTPYTVGEASGNRPE